MTRLLEIEKWVWTDDDFDRMSFHDVHVVAMAARASDASAWNLGLLLDIDWIVEWLCDRETRFCEFAVAPATMGDIELSASGFKLYLRKPPVVIASQQLDMKEHQSPRAAA